jgi:hypothetical protein
MVEGDHDMEQQKNLIDHINEQEAADKKVCLREDEAETLTERKRTTLWKRRCDNILKARKDGPYLKYRKETLYAYLRKRAGGSR